MKLLVMITNHGVADKICERTKEVGLQYEHVFLGTGTARSDILELLGLGTTEREVVIGTVLEERLEGVYRVLREEFNFERKGGGIAFTVPLTAVGGPASHYILSGGQRK